MNADQYDEKIGEVLNELADTETAIDELKDKVRNLQRTIEALPSVADIEQESDSE